MYGSTCLGAISEDDVSQFEKRRTYNWRNNLRRISMRRGILYEKQKIPADKQLLKTLQQIQVDLPTLGTCTMYKG